ncbi:MAG: dicarboxylate/amino acid:cation symporter [Burkholderiales bacterium]
MKKKFSNSLIMYFIAIFLGILSGISDISFLQTFGLLIADIFIKVFKCISLPIIALSLIVTLSSYSKEGTKQNIWQRTLFYTLTTTLIAACISCILYLFINPANINLNTQNTFASKHTNLSYSEHIIHLIPANIFAPFLEHQVISVLLVGIVIGIAIRYIQDDAARTTISHFFKGAHGLFLVITTWIVKIIPLALFGFITATLVQLRQGMDIKGIGEYLLIIVLANLLQGFVILPLWLKINHIKPFETMRGMLPALSIAFFSKSSAGTLPVTMETAEKNLKIHPRISRFVLPLCTSINMNGCAAFIFITVIYLMQNHGIEITLSTMASWIIIATIAAIGNAGVPMGCFFLSASLLASMNVPITLLGIILPFYSIIDMVETALNVWSDACVAKVVNEKTMADQENLELTA